MFGSNTKLKVYLSGPMEYAVDGGTGWREAAEKRLLEAGFDIFNPCRSSTRILHRAGLQDPDQYNALKKSIQENFQDRERYLDVTRQFIELDLTELRTSHLVLVQVDRVASGGTAGELTLAHHLGIPIVGFCPGDITQVSGWVLGCIDHLSFPVEGIASPLEIAIGRTIYLGQQMLENS
jgi:nucleoside 2-deoxyribosyltransferase